MVVNAELGRKDGLQRVQKNLLVVIEMLCVILRMGEEA
jgi:hypothetical protein